jgi:hypothetical protein
MGMDWLLLGLAAAFQAPPAPKAEARAYVRVLTGATISGKTWKRESRRFERTVRELDGRTYRLRLVDFE